MSHTWDDRFPTDDEGHRVVKNVHNPEVRLRHPWGATDFVQGGGGRHRTAFVEVCTDSQNLDRNAGGTFLRGEGATIEEAEDAAWEIYQRQVGCPSPTGRHENETRGYKNGAGFCRYCGRFQSHAFTLAEIGSICFLCGADYADDIGGRMVCASHMPPSYSEIDSHDADGHKMPQWVSQFLPAPFRETEFDERYTAVTTAREHFVDVLAAQQDDAARAMLRNQMWHGIEDIFTRMDRQDAERAAERAAKGDEQVDAEFAEALSEVLTALSSSTPDGEGQ